MRRATRGSVFLILVLACLAALAAAAVAAPPTLTGQAVNQQIFLSQGPEKFDCHDNPDGTIDVTYSFRGGGATGPYPGNWSESGKVRLGPIDDPIAGVNRKIQSLDATFTFSSPAGEVSGTKRLAPASGNDAGVFCSDFAIGYITAQTTYAATIVTAAGVFTDRGRAPTTIDQDRAGQPVLNYRASYTSDLPTPAQNESALFGQRTPGGSFSAMSANTKRASPFTLFAPATVRKVYAYVDGGGAASGAQAIRAVLYRNSGGLPAAQVTRSFDFSVPAGMSGRWVPLYLAPTAQLNPGVYWIGIQSGATNGVARFAWNSKPNARRFNVDSFGDGPSDPFGTALADDQQLSIFAAGSY